MAIEDRSTEQLAAFAERCRPLFVLSGAGCSTASGIPDYRGADGQWKRGQPINYRRFLASPPARRRYWARSMIGWPRVARAAPCDAHAALARLEAAGYVRLLVTQNVDGLHQRAGHRAVVDLHGRLDTVQCLDCGGLHSREAIQQALAALNPGYDPATAADAPDGDVDLPEAALAGFRIPDCPHCGGLLKPSVVFFGENVPLERVEAAYAGLREAGGVLAVGTSLMVYSGYRFLRAAAAEGKAAAAVNHGRTRADALLALKHETECGAALSRLAAALGL